MPSLTRRKFVRLTTAAGVAALAADTTLLAPNHVRVVRQQIALPRWPARLEGFTIALLSDFHYDPYFSIHPIHSAISLVNDLHPEMIVLTGDFISAPWLGDVAEAAAKAEPCAQLLRQLRAPHGLWAVLGNHDVYTDPDRVTAALQSAGIQVLSNRSEPCERDGARFWLAGVDDILVGTPDLDAALHGIPAGEPTVLLAHEPDYADHVSRHTVDLQLSGHSHGGQVRVPFLGPLYVPDLGRKYVWGLYKIGGLTLYTNPGLGTVRAPIRMNCPPEITLITLHPATTP